MKKKSGLNRAMSIVPLEELETLNTKVLMARLKRLRFCEESAVHSDLTEAELSTVGDQILFKSDPNWQSAYRDIKTILDNREHQSRKS